MKKHIIVRITTVPLSLEKLLENQLRFINFFFKVIAVSSNEEKLKELGRKQEIETFHLELTRSITPIRDLKAVIKLYRFLKKESPLIVHTHTPKAGVVGMLASYLAKVPHRLHTVAGLPLLETKGFKRGVLNFVEKLTYKCATKVYPNSFGLKDIILENKFVNEKKIKVIANGSSNGINTLYFNPELFSEELSKILKNDLKIQKEDFVFIFVGRIVGDKGINELVAAFNKLSYEDNKVKLLLVGPFEEELDPLEVKTLNIIRLNKQIISVGFQQDVRPYFAISSALVFPSYREGFPNVVMQAGAMGLPAIVSNINGCNEIIKNGVNGIIIPVKNVNAVFYAMKTMMKNDTMKNNTRKMITELYEQKLIWQALLAEYKSLEKHV
ncbi:MULTISPECIES: glycosyltransferase family 4 protein [Flavobacteriaceae]|uniref:glycosyltransferase family 4 protein n=1 Tax=Flavobacteriaceae TaxID=49546 RepID=UPI003AA9A023